MYAIRKTTVLIDEVRKEAGREDGKPLRRVIMMAAVNNPLIERFEPDLTMMMNFGAELGTLMAQRILKEFDGDPGQIQGYGKGAIVGTRGEIEHGYALITRPFARPIREAFGPNARAWMASAVKRGALGASLDLPIASKQALYVRSHYDTVDVTMPDGPLPDEVIVVLAGSNRGRLHARIGGLRLQDLGETGHDQYLDRE
jgi:Amino acid synthesis